jgi:hypothetical protein
VELPLAELGGTPGGCGDDDREQQPAAAEQERHGATVAATGNP